MQERHPRLHVPQPPERARVIAGRQSSPRRLAPTSAASAGHTAEPKGAVNHFQALLHHRVPFLFHTGNADAAMLKAWPHVLVLTKPASSGEIVARVADLVY